MSNLGKEPCEICEELTINIPEGITSETYVCSVCEGKYGDKLFKKLCDLDVKFNAETEDKEEESEPFEAHIEIKGGTKKDIINVIVSMMDANDVTLQEVEENMY
jgi:hypothetical protein